MKFKLNRFRAGISNFPAFFAYGWKMEIIKFEIANLPHNIILNLTFLNTNFYLTYRKLN